MWEKDECMCKGTQELLNKIPSGVAIIEMNAKNTENNLHVICYNECFYRSSGYTGEEFQSILQKGFFCYVFEEDAELLLTDFRKLCEGETGGSARSMVRCHTKGNRYHWMVINSLLAEKCEEISVINIATIDMTDLGGLSGQDEMAFRITGEQRILKAAEEKSAVDKAVAGKPEAPADIAVAEARYRAKRRILIVDDNSTIRLLLITTLKDDYVIDTAKDGNEAMTRLWQFGSTISAVLLDLVMPGVDGFEILKKMRENPILCKIPVIIVSSNDERETIKKAMEYGAADFITKPVDTELLQLRLKSAIDRVEN